MVWSFGHGEWLVSLCSRSVAIGHGAWRRDWGCAAGVPSLYMYNRFSVCSFLWLASSQGEGGGGGRGVFKVRRSSLKGALEGGGCVFVR